VLSQFSEAMKPCPVCALPCPQKGHVTCGRSYCQQTNCLRNRAANARGKRRLVLEQEAAKVEASALHWVRNVTQP
jgi:hypothetical protein